MPAELATTLDLTDDDRLLTAEAVVRSYCGWHIAPVKPGTYEGPWCDNVLVLPTLRLVSVESITDSDGTVVDPADYGWTHYGAIYRTRVRGPVYVGTGYPSTRPVTVEYTHGYTQVPADISGAVVALASQAMATTPGLQSKTTGPFSETYLSGVDAYGTQRTILDRYRLPARA